MAVDINGHSKGNSLGNKRVQRRLRRKIKLKGLARHINTAILMCNLMEPRYHIFFSKFHLTNLEGLVFPAIVFSPSLDSWNDFNLKTWFTYEICASKNQRVTPGNHLVHLAFITDRREESPAQEIEALFASTRSSVLPATKVQQFYTLLPDIRAYRDIVQLLGTESAEAALLAMNDLVAVKQSGRLPAWYNQATASAQFNLAFVRKSESFFAFNSAASVLSGLEQESLRGMSDKFQLNFHLPTFRNFHKINFTFEFESALPKRISVIIGKNGTGKSQSLRHIANALQLGLHEFADSKGGKPIINRLLAVSSPGETRGTFPAPKRRSKIVYNRVFLTRHAAGDRHSGLGDALVRLVRSSEERIRGKTKWAIFCDGVKQIAPPQELCVKMQDPDSESAYFEETFPLLTLPEGGELQRLERWGKVDARADIFRKINGQLIPLSSGQLTFIRFAAQVCLHIENGTLVLIDEPETHLHPNYIADFVCLLDRLLKETGSFAILATHSPYFVREVPRSQVIMLRESATQVIETVPIRLKTLGADIGAISAFVFEEQPHGFFIDDLGKQLANQGAMGKEILNSLEHELPAEAVMYLRDIVDDNK